MTEKTTRPGIKNFFAFEGIDGCGKSTQIELLVKHFNQLGFAVEVLREPGGCSISEAVRSILLSKDLGKMEQVTELLLYSAARAQLVREKIAKILESGRILLADRYAWATYAYQGSGRGLDWNQIHQLQQLACNGYWPYLTFLLDILPKTGFERRQLVGKPRDRMESEDISFFQRVSDGYHRLVLENPEAFVVLNGEKSAENVNQEIIKYLGPLLLKPGQ